MNTAINKTLLLITVIFMDLLTGMEFDLFVPSFPELQSHFQLSAFWVEASLSINFIGYCASLFFVGSLSDHYGRKPVILSGLITFIFGSLLCLYAHSYNIFLVGRLLQGIGIAAPSILSFLIIADDYPVKEQQFLMAMLNGSLNTAAAVAPVLGSYITLYFHWQGNFGALFILGTFTLILTIAYIPSGNLSKPKELSTFGKYRPIFQSKFLWLLIVTIIFIFVPYWIFVGMSPLLFINDLNVSLNHFGYYQGLFALIFALGSVAFGLLLKRHDYQEKRLLIIANFILVLSLMILLWVALTNNHNPLIITLAFVPFIIGQIIPSTILYPIALNYLPHVKGKVAAIIQAGRLLLAAVGLEIAGYFYQHSFKSVGIVIAIFILSSIILLHFLVKQDKRWQPRS